MDKNKIYKILIAGEGGQGIQAMSDILADSAIKSNYFASYMPHYGVEMRMGISVGFIQISRSCKISYPKSNTVDLAAVLTKRDTNFPKEYIGQETFIINSINLTTKIPHYPYSEKSLNMLCLGIILKKLTEFDFPIKKEIVIDKIHHKFHKNIQENIHALEMGLKLDEIYFNKPLSGEKPDIFPLKHDSFQNKAWTIYPEFCKGCGLCLEKCPVDALAWSKKYKNFISRPIPEIDLKKCISCKICENICPDCAIKIYK